MRRYTHCGDPAAEARIRQDLARLAAGIDADLGERLEALLLVGAYARGEGSVVDRHGEASGYPGYRCILVTAPGAELPRRDVHQLEQSWSRRLHVAVHLAVRGAESLRRAPANLWWLDIARGNVEVLSGDPHTLQRLRALDVGNVPRTACGWLLCDTALGIALSRLAPETAEVDRLRQLHTAVIACGDARVLFSGRFGGTMRARRGQLEALSAAPELLVAYDDAIAFLTRPERWRPATGTTAQWEAAIRDSICGWHLTFEGKRVGTPTTAERFARDRETRFSAAPGGGPISLLRGAARRLLAPAPSFPYVSEAQEILPRAAVALAYGELRAGNRLIAARLLGIGGPATGIDDGRIIEALLRLVPEVHEHHSGQLFPGTFYGPF